MTFPRSFLFGNTTDSDDGAQVTAIRSTALLMVAVRTFGSRTRRKSTKT
jgi:hypothetical protein